MRGKKVYFPSADLSAGKCRVFSFKVLNAKKSSFCRLQTAQSKSRGIGVLDLPSLFPLLLGFICRTSLQAITWAKRVLKESKDSFLVLHQTWRGKKSRLEEGSKCPCGIMLV